MKPSKHTIQFLLPTASPGEIELVYREIMSKVPEQATETKSLGKDYQGYSRGFNTAIDQFTAAINETFGKEG